MGRTIRRKSTKRTLAKKPIEEVTFTFPGEPTAFYSIRYMHRLRWLEENGTSESIVALVVFDPCPKP